jgi:hypothetical protein
MRPKSQEEIWSASKDIIRQSQLRPNTHKDALEQRSVTRLLQIFFGFQNQRVGHQFF